MLFAGALTAGEKNMMHCFTFTPVESATQADWDAFFKASDAMPSKMKGIVNRVWYGKLRNTLAIYALPNADDRKKVVAGEKGVKTEVSFRPRSWGMCIELKGLDSLKKYDDHPYHKEWVAIYSKVRVEGTTTFDILGQ